VITAASGYSSAYDRVMWTLAVGEPSWKINTDGGWDFVPILIALVGLLILKVVFRIRLRWYVVTAIVLLAPLFRALGDVVGMPAAVGMALVVATVGITAARRSKPDEGRPNV
jgi:hypothetical protein